MKNITAVIATVATALLLSGCTSPTAPSAETTQAAPSVSSLAHRTAGDPLAQGPVDAPVVLIEWSDYRCPFCAVFANDTLPTLRDEYIDTGKVRFEFRDLALFGEQSIDAATAVRAAGEQGHYFAYADTLFAAAPEKGHPDMPTEKLIGFARTAGVPDIARFERDLAKPELRAAVQDDTAQARQLGAGGTPFFLVGNTPLSGAQPVSVFRQVIEDELAAAGGR